MAVTENTYTGNGSTVLYSFTFPYLATTDIKVSINGTLTTAYTLANATTVQFNTAPANGAAIRIYRETADATTKATFFPGSAIRSQDLNDNFLQVLYKSQETETFAASTDASAIQATANTALANSNTAISTANAASATANAADATANAIAATANTALSNSTTAVSTANTANSNATSAIAIANAALPKTGGTMTGNIIFNASQTFLNVLPLSGGTLTGNLNVPSLNGGPLAGARNRIINGDMRIDQRNAGASVTVNSSTVTFSVDRWYGQGDTADGVFTLQRVADGPTGFSNSVKATITTADSSIGANQAYKVIQRIEGNNLEGLGLGTSGASAFTISFWVKSSLTGTFGGSLWGASASEWFPFSYSISSANTWEYKTVSVSARTTGSFDTSTGVGLQLQFSLGAGSSRLTTGGAWITNASAEYYGVTGQTNPIGTLNATFYITGVQLEPGTVATPFERRSYGQELALCQRYYQIYTSSGPNVFMMNFTAGGQGNSYFFFGPEMRATPTGTLTSSTVVNGTGSASIVNSKVFGLSVSSTSSGLAYFTAFNVNFAAEL